MGVLIKTYTDKKCVAKTIYQCLHFMSSAWLMSCLLDLLTWNLPPDRFNILDYCFSNYNAEDKNLLRRKGYYPYTYFGDSEKTLKRATGTRAREKCFALWEASVTATQWEHAENFFEQLECQNVGDDHHLCLKINALILACAEEEFRKLCYNAYGLDSAHFFACSILSADALVKRSQAPIELLTEREHLKMVNIWFLVVRHLFTTKDSSVPTTDTLPAMITVNMTHMGSYWTQTLCRHQGEHSYSIDG